MRLKDAFEDLQPQNVLTMFLFSKKHSYVLTVKITPVFNNFFLNFTWYERTTVSNSLHVRSNFWCLIMALTKLIQYVYTCHSFVSEIYKKNQSLLF